MLRFCHMLPDLFNENGSWGNLALLKYRAQKRDLDVKVDVLNKTQTSDLTQYNLIYIGAGQEKDMSASAEFFKVMSQPLREYVENDGVILAIGGGFHMLCKYVQLQSGERLEGAGILNCHTIYSSKRTIGEVIAETEFGSVYGFENSNSETKTSEPFAMVQNRGEGVRYKNVFCTNLHGPVLAKSPNMTDGLLLKALTKSNIKTLAPLDDYFETKAREMLLK